MYSIVLSDWESYFCDQQATSFYEQAENCSILRIMHLGSNISSTESVVIVRIVKVVKVSTAIDRISP